MRVKHTMVKIHLPNEIKVVQFLWLNDLYIFIFKML